MTDEDFATEVRLRHDAIGAQPGAVDVLADFYEERGQLSRAALWRHPNRNKKTYGERDRTCVEKLSHTSPVDPRRDAMIWILCLTDLPFAAIGKAFKLSVSRVREVANRIDREIYFAARAERLQTDPAIRRLRAARAILVQSETDAEDAERACSWICDEPSPRRPEVADAYLTWLARKERERTERTLHVEIPPASWPYTRPHEEHRRTISGPYTREHDEHRSNGEHDERHKIR